MNGVLVVVSRFQLRLERVGRGAAEPPQRRLVVGDGVGVGHRSSEHT